MHANAPPIFCGAKLVAKRAHSGGAGSTNLRWHLVNTFRSGRASPDGVGKRMNPRKSAAPRDGKRLLELRIRFAGKANDDVG